ncbi:MAG: CheY-like chemotaxis protein [Myxococcota bacterium]|jgi:CheY-like chemotaxis protein
MGALSHILLVTDDLGDILLTRRAVARGGHPVRLHTASSNAAALAFLRQEHSPRPRLVIVDAGLCGEQGLAVVSSLKSDPELSSIPVAVFTGVGSEEAVTAAYRAGASCCVCEPVGLSRVIGEIVGYFVGVSLPG